MNVAGLRGRRDRDDDECVGSACGSHEGWPAATLAVRADVGVGQVGRIEHDVRRKAFDASVLYIRHHVFRRQHVSDAGPRRRLESALCKGIGNNALDLVAALALGAQLRDLQHARQERARPLDIEAFRLLTDWQRVLDNGRKAVLAVANLDVARLV
jgi:hypothetical protein